MFITKSRSKENSTNNNKPNNSNNKNNMIQQSNTSETNESNKTPRSSRRESIRRGSIGPSKNATVVESMLLRDVPDRKTLYNDITANNSTQAQAVILILHIKPKQITSFAFRSSKTLDTAHTAQTSTTAQSKHCDPIEELQLIQAARAVFEENGLFNDTFTLVKYDDKRIFAMCTDGVVAMEKMIQAKQLIETQFASLETATVNVSGGCEEGALFELVNDYFGDPVNVASKLAEDTAGSGELLVSFGGKEAQYIRKFRNRADFIKGSVEVSKVQIEYYFMEEKEPVSFMEKICCLVGSGSGGKGGSGNCANVPRGGLRGSAISNADSAKNSAPVDLRSSTKSSTLKAIPEKTAAKEQALGNPNNEIYDLDSKPQNKSKQQGSQDDTIITGVDILDENGQNMLLHDTLSSHNNPRPVTPPGAEWEELVMLQSDLSGFTRLTKKYGILHFMTLILNCRKIFNMHLFECDGEILKYDGDNNICKFTSTEQAIEYVLRVRADLDKYNEGKEEDFQIRAKMGMAKGSVIVSQDGDIVGDAWEQCCYLSEEMAKVGEILISEEIKSDLKGLSFNCEFEKRLPNEEEEMEMEIHYNLTLKPMM